MSKRSKLERLPPEIEERALQMRADGESFNVIAKEMGFESTLQLSRYRKLFPDFESEMESAIVAYCEKLEDEYLDIVHKYEPEVAKLLSTNIKTTLEWKNPKRYSPKQQIDVNHHVDIAGALERAQNRIIDVTPKLIKLPKRES